MRKSSKTMARERLQAWADKLKAGDPVRYTAPGSRYGPGLSINARFLSRRTDINGSVWYSVETYSARAVWARLSQLAGPNT